VWLRLAKLIAADASNQLWMKITSMPAGTLGLYQEPSQTSASSYAGKVLDASLVAIQFATRNPLTQ
jgi:hypothetical protein